MNEIDFLKCQGYLLVQIWNTSIPQIPVLAAVINARSETHGVPCGSNPTETGQSKQKNWSEQRFC